MEDTHNLQIVQRLVELATNTLDYSLFPKPYKEQYIFLANVINDSLSKIESEFNKEFERIVSCYKETLSGKGRFPKTKFGWFHNPEKIVYINTQMNQLRYAIYGERHVREIKFNEKLKNRAYKDLIQQIDCTVLMTPTQLKTHQSKCSAIAKRVMSEILKEEKRQIKAS